MDYKKLMEKLVEMRKDFAEIDKTFELVNHRKNIEKNIDMRSVIVEYCQKFKMW